MTPETGREAECWIKLSLLTALSVPEILRLLQQTGGVEALFDASSGTLTKLAGETAAREIREVKEALQKYPEQSFAQKFSLCNRQKFSGRKIKEGF